MLRIYQVDAFHHQVLRGNPAAVIPLDQWLPDEQLQAIAGENNLSETAFFLPKKDGAMPLRWFTPNKEVRLCGHATLATAHVLYNEIGITTPTICFETLSGRLTVERHQQAYLMNFPADFGREIPIPEGLSQALGAPVQKALAGQDDILAILDSEKAVASLQPDFNALLNFDHIRGVIASAPGDSVDFVSRCFYPKYAINEDPVTGSAHTLMTPYWAETLAKQQLSAKQLSQRLGILECTLQENRVLLQGAARTYLRGQIYLD